jgi:hypothetical protein
VIALGGVTTFALTRGSSHGSAPRDATDVPAVVVGAPRDVATAPASGDATPGTAPADPALATASDAPLTAAPRDTGIVATVPADAGVTDAPHRRAPESIPTATPGRFSIESTPYATIYIDSKRFDVTPIVKRPLAAGKHRVRAVLADGRHQERTIDVPSGGQAEPINLSW